MKTITTRIPEEDEKHLKEIEEEMGARRSEVSRRLIEEGIKKWREKKALRLLSDHKITLRKAAKIAGLTYLEMLDIAQEEGIEVGYDFKELEKDLERI